MKTFTISIAVFVAVGLLASPAAAQREGVELVQKLRPNIAPPLRNIPPEPGRGGPLRIIPKLLIQPERPEPEAPDGALQTSVGPAVPATSSSFDGVGQGFVGPQGGYTVNAAPPDTNLSVGDTQIVQWVNLSFAVFDKSGNALWGPVPGKTLWAGMPLPGGPAGSHPCAQTNDGDPIIVFDKAAHRWVGLQLSYANGPPYYVCFAVSTSSDATSSWCRYALDSGNNFPDYPKLGVWPDGYYLSLNMFAPPFWFFIGAQVWALDRTSMLSCGDADGLGFQLSSSYGSLLPSDLDGSTAPPSGSPNYFLNRGSNALRLWKFHVDFTPPGNATLTGPTSIPTAAFTSACGSNCISQPGTSQKLDGLGDRLMYRLAYRNLGTAQSPVESLVVNHSVNISSGSGRTKTSKVGVRWYEIRNPNGAPVVNQQGTFSPDSDNRWMGSIAQDKQGNIALGYSVSSKNTYPSIRYTGRLVGDPLNTLQGENKVLCGVNPCGTGSQLQNLDRWGDYSSMSIDPADDCTFWYTTEYLTSSGTFNWHTRIASFKLCK